MRRRRWVLARGWLLTLPIGLGGTAGLIVLAWMRWPASFADWFTGLWLLCFFLMMLCLTVERDKCPRP